jgi:hypothetical protein
METSFDYDNINIINIDTPDLSVCSSMDNLSIISDFGDYYEYIDFSSTTEEYDNMIINNYDRLNPSAVTTPDIPEGATTPDIPEGATTPDIPEGATTPDIPEGATTPDTSGSIVITNDKENDIKNFKLYMTKKLKVNTLQYSNDENCYRLFKRTCQWKEWVTFQMFIGIKMFSDIDMKIWKITDSDYDKQNVIKFLTYKSP